MTIKDTRNIQTLCLLYYLIKIYSNEEKSAEDEKLIFASEWQNQVGPTWVTY